MRGAGSLDEGVSLEDLAVKTQVPGLSVLPSGSPTHSIPNLLHSPHTSELLRRAREEFDSVLIDTPPMMQISDARVVGQMADAVILVLRAGQTTRGTAKAAAERFIEDGTRLLGTILNSWDPKANGYGYYDSYRYYDYLVIHFTLVVNQAILGLAPLAAKIGAIERGLSKASGGVH